MKKVFTVLCFD